MSSVYMNNIDFRTKEQYLRDMTKSRRKSVNAYYDIIIDPDLSPHAKAFLKTRLDSIETFYFNELGCKKQNYDIRNKLGYLIRNIENY